MELVRGLLIFLWSDEHCAAPAQGADTLSDLPQRLLTAWNERDQERLFALLSDPLEVTLRGRGRNRPNPVATSKHEFAAFIASLPETWPRFELVSALGDAFSTCLSLTDEAGLRLQVICGTEDGRISRLAIFRPADALLAV